MGVEGPAPTCPVVHPDPLRKGQPPGCPGACPLCVLPHSCRSGSLTHQVPLGAADSLGAPLASVTLKGERGQGQSSQLKQVGELD